MKMNGKHFENHIEMQYEESDDVVSLTITSTPSRAFCLYNTIDVIYISIWLSSYRTFTLSHYVFTVFTSLTSLHPVPIRF